MFDKISNALLKNAIITPMKYGIIQKNKCSFIAYPGQPRVAFTKEPVLLEWWWHHG